MMLWLLAALAFAQDPAPEPEAEPDVVEPAAEPRSRARRHRLGRDRHPRGPTRHRAAHGVARLGGAGHGSLGRGRVPASQGVDGPRTPRARRAALVRAPDHPVQVRPAAHRETTTPTARSRSQRSAERHRARGKRVDPPVPQAPRSRARRGARRGAARESRPTKRSCGGRRSRKSATSCPIGSTASGAPANPCRARPCSPRPRERRAARCSTTGQPRPATVEGQAILRGRGDLARGGGAGLRAPADRRGAFRRRVPAHRRPHPPAVVSRKASGGAQEPVAAATLWPATRRRGPNAHLDDAPAAGGAGL